MIILINFNTHFYLKSLKLINKNKINNNNKLKKIINRLEELENFTYNI